MKKTLLYLILAAGLMGCAKEVAPTADETLTGKPVTFDIHVLQTKAESNEVTKEAWEAGDVIYVFFQGLGPKCLKLCRNEDGTWENVPVGDPMTVEDFTALKEDERTLTAVHIPVAVDVKYENADGSFSFSSDGKPVYTYYLAQTGGEYEYSEEEEKAVVSATLGLKQPTGVALFYVPVDVGEERIDDTDFTDFTLGSPQVQPVACVAVSQNGEVKEEVLQPGARMPGIVDLEGFTFAGRLIPSVPEIYTFSLAGDDTFYTLKRNSKDLYGGRMNEGWIYTFPARTDLDNTGKGWSYKVLSDLVVDMGLSVMWAKCNLGATEETEKGNYFAWGEIAGYSDRKVKETFSWANYYWTAEEAKTQNDYSGNYITKYTLADNEQSAIWYNGSTFSGDGKDSLDDYDYADDAAYAALGLKFRIPTLEEWEELWDDKNCTWQRVYGQNSLDPGGFLVTSKITGKDIFLPIAYRQEQDGIQIDEKNSGGWYWSSSLGANSRFATGFRFYSEYESGKTEVLMKSANCYRYFGLSVRPVYKE